MKNIVILIQINPPRKLTIQQSTSFVLLKMTAGFIPAEQERVDGQLEDRPRGMGNIAPVPLVGSGEKVQDPGLGNILTTSQVDSQMVHINTDKHSGLLSLTRTRTFQGVELYVLGTEMALDESVVVA